MYVNVFCLYLLCGYIIILTIYFQVNRFKDKLDPRIVQLAHGPIQVGSLSTSLNH